MSARRVSVLFLGLWLGCIVMMAWVAMTAITAPDELVKHPSDPVQREIRDIGSDRSRALLRFGAAELNRNLFVLWERFQILLGIVLGVILLFATNGNRFVMALIGAMVAIVVVQYFLVTPQIIELGRGLDFAGPGDMPDERKAFHSYHTYYLAMEIAKLLVGFVLAVRMMLSRSLRRSMARKRRWKEVDAVDHPDHSHIDG